MKNILIINADLFKTEATEFLLSAYVDGARQENHQVRKLAIADQLFNFNRQFPSSQSAKLESDLEAAWRQMLWANHIVLFCPVFATHIPSKVNGIFERLFNQNEPSIHTWRSQALHGRSARIVSVLDERLFQEWMLDKTTSFMAIKKEVFKRMHINPVHTATIGHLHTLDNEYSQKWTKKLYTFGQKGI